MLRALGSVCRSFSSLLLALVAAGLLSSSYGEAAVWTNQHQWFEPLSSTWIAQNRWFHTEGTNPNPNWEDAYSQWVATQVNETIFSSPSSPYYGIATDCADAVYTIRLIFASLNGLPYVITGSNGQFISNSTALFDRVPESQRSRKFISYVQEQTSTWTLPNDTYPVAITPEYVRPGSILLYYRNHSLTVHKVDEFGIIEFLASTDPREVRTLDIRSAIAQPPSSDYVRALDGLRNWRHHELEIPATSERGFSREQFQFPKSPESAWGDAVQQKLQVFAEDPRTTLDRFTANLCQSVKLARVNVVNDGVAALARLHRQGRSCMSQNDYDNYSTPNRDATIRVSFENIDQLIQTYNDGPEGQELARYENHLLEQCVICYAPGRDANQPCVVGADMTTTLLNFKNALLNEEVSSSPNDPLAKRWGVPTREARPACPAYKE